MSAAPCDPTTGVWSKATAASGEVRDVLAQAEFNGTEVTLPPLDRRLYAQVNKVLVALGGTWVSKRKAHVFPDDVDPEPLLAAVIAGKTVQHELTAALAEGFVPTPPELARDMARYQCDLEDLGAGWRVLEPSAGDGALVRVILDVQPECTVVAVEPNTERAAKIPADPRVTLVAGTIEDYADDVLAGDGELFDLALMNPPYSKPGEPALWAAHVRYAWSLLKPGGQLVSIVPASFEFRQDTVFTQLRDWVERNDGQYMPLRSEPFPMRSGLLTATKPDRPDLR